MPAVSDRPAVKGAVVDLLNTAAEDAEEGVGLHSVRVFYSTPGDEEPDASIVAGHVTGEQDTVAFGVDRQGVDDKFTIVLTVKVRTSNRTVREADALVQRILNGIGDVLFTIPRLDVATSSTVIVRPGRLDGPNPTEGDPTEALTTQAFLELRCSVAIR